MLELFYYERNLLITTVTEGSVFKKIDKNITSEENVRIRYYFCSGTITLKHHKIQTNFLKVLCYLQKEYI